MSHHVLKHAEIYVCSQRVSGKSVAQLMAGKIMTIRRFSVFTSHADFIRDRKSIDPVHEHLPQTSELGLGYRLSV